MEWTILVVIGTVITFAIATLTPIIKLNSTITRLTVVLDSLEERMVKLDDNNRESHTRIYDRLDEHSKRITRLEIRSGDGNKEE